MHASFCVFYIEKCQKGRAWPRKKELCVRVCSERSKDEARASSYPLTEVFLQLCTQLVTYPIMSYRLSEVASNRLNEKTANDSEPRRRESSPWHGCAMTISWAGCTVNPSESSVLAKGFDSCKEPWLKQEGAGGEDRDTLVRIVLCHHRRYLSSLLATLSNVRKTQVRNLSCK